MPFAGLSVRTASDFPGWLDGWSDRIRVRFGRLSSPEGNIHITDGNLSLSARATTRSTQRKCLGRASKTRWPRYKPVFF